MKSARRFALVLSALVLLAGTSTARDQREQERIDYLIDSLGKLQGAVFIRNGAEYTATDAQGHLRRKLAYAGDRVTTAEQFIKYCASESSMSHQPYKIRLADGKTVNTATFFEEELKAFKP